MFKSTDVVKARFGYHFGMFRESDAGESYVILTETRQTDNLVILTSSLCKFLANGTLRGSIYTRLETA